MNKQELEKQAEALYTDVRIFLDNTFELIDQIHEAQSNCMSDEVDDWYYNHADDLSRAWLDGFEIEQEKLYTVEIPNPNAKYSRIVLQRLREDALHLKEYTGDDWKTYKMNQLTEAEIKQDFEWAWQFREEVE